MSHARLPNVAIIGRPNVGKSALFNRLAGRKIAIVHDQPGITRDRISAICSRGKKTFTIWDTGGIFGAGEAELTEQVHRTAESAFRESDLLLFVVDAKAGLSPIDEDLARSLRKSRKPTILVVNKIDNDKNEPLAADFDSLGFDRAVSVSAEHNRGTAELLDQIDQFLPKVSAQISAVSAPLKLAIIGRPNVGKSSLINAIMQSERAIVSELPGTTRDSIDIAYQRDGKEFLFIDTAGIRRRGKLSSSVEVFSVMRAERSIRRADLCVLIVDLTSGVTAQDKRIAGLIQEERKAGLVILNKWDLVKPKRGGAQRIRELATEARERIFFLDYAPVLIASAQSGENVERLFQMIDTIERASAKRIGTGVFNRLIRAAFAANPPPMVKGKRLKLFYAAQTAGREDRKLQPPEFVLFVNDPRLLPRAYGRYLEVQIRRAEPYPGLPIILTLRPRTQK
ncbi:MAG TPA: ribosome biogenesis GTPase Der [Chthoniobacterales bacterium]|jgi:ribosome-associated GTPase EngA|nr:ribosome biogenesis GTPase Der [Chthoniobacterales bacterium]